MILTKLEKRKLIKLCDEIQELRHILRTKQSITELIAKNIYYTVLYTAHHDLVIQVFKNGHSISYYQFNLNIELTPDEIKGYPTCQAHLKEILNILKKECNVN